MRNKVFAWMFESWLSFLLEKIWPLMSIWEWATKISEKFFLGQDEFLGGKRGYLTPFDPLPSTPKKVELFGDRNFWLWCARESRWLFLWGWPELWCSEWRQSMSEKWTWQWLRPTLGVGQLGCGRHYLSFTIWRFQNKTPK